VIAAVVALALLAAIGWLRARSVAADLRRVSAELDTTYEAGASLITERGHAAPPADRGTCAELDEFFDGELATKQAAAFCEHLGSCERCQRILLGRMQEEVVTSSGRPSSNLLFPEGAR
jgi:hypothetical protein